MFMALDLQCRDGLDYDSIWLRGQAPLPEYFRPTSNHSTAAEQAFDRAFSPAAAMAHGYNARHAELYDSSVFENQLSALRHHFLSKIFIKRTIYVPPSSAHQFRHDIESCFWGTCGRLGGWWF